MEFKNTKAEYDFFELVEKERFQQCCILESEYEVFPFDGKSILSELIDIQQKFKGELLDNITPNISLFYLYRVKERVEGIVCELSNEEYSEIHNDYGSKCHAELIVAYSRLNGFKTELLEFINEHISLANSFDKIKPPIDTNIKLSDIFESITKYRIIMEILVRKGFCQANTYIWKDEKGGNKFQLVSILKSLKVNGYYKRLPTNKEYSLIASNTFQINISEESFKSRIDRPLLDCGFIKPSSSIS